MPEQLGVAQPEEGAAQNAHHRGPVVGVGQRAQQVGQCGDRGRLREGRSAAHLDGQPEGLDRPRVDRQGPPRPGQDEEVAGRAAARVDLRPDEARDHLGVEPGRRVAPRRRRESRWCARRDAGSAVVAGRLEPREPGLMRSGLGREQLAEGAVDPLAEGGHGAEARGERRDLAAGRLDPLPDGLIDVDVGPPEPVDRLLGVADDEQRSGPERHARPVPLRARRAREQQDHLGLDRVGVLELVDEEPAILVLEGGADLQVVAEQGRGVLEQVVVVQRDGAPAGRGGVLPALEQQGQREAVDVPEPRVQEGQGLAVERGEERFHSLLVRLAARPPLLDDPRLALPLGGQLGDHARVVERGHPQAPGELAHALLNAARGLAGPPVGQQRGERGPEAFQRGPRPGRIGPRRVAGRERHLGVVAHLLERAVEIDRPHAGVEQLSQGGGALAALAIEVVAPGPSPLVHLGHLVQLAEARRHAGLHRPLPQQVGAERMNGPREEPLQVPQRMQGALPPDRIRFGRERALQRELKARAQLRGGLPGEGDGGHLLDLVAALEDSHRHPLGQALGLARAGARLDQQVDVEALADQVPGRLVGRGGPLTHARGASGTPRAGRCRRARSSPAPARRRGGRTPGRIRRSGSPRPGSACG